MTQITELMYDRVKDSLQGQTTHYTALISRISTMFTASTAIVGIGLPLAITQLPSDDDARAILIWLAVIPLVGYIIAAWVAIRGLALGTIQTLDDPKWVKHFQGKPDQEFIDEMWTRIETNHAANDKVLLAKAGAAKTTLWMSAFLTITVVAYVIAVIAIGLVSSEETKQVSTVAQGIL